MGMAGLRPAMLIIRLKVQIGTDLNRASETRASIENLGLHRLPRGVHFSLRLSRPGTTVY